MAEHGNIDFEHDIGEQLKMLDEKIQIPEIPDAQGIFVLAEKPKTKVIPFANYRKFAGIAAAVVLLLASVPVVSGMLGVGFDKAASEAAAEEPCAEPAEYVNGSAMCDVATEEAVEEPMEMPPEENESLNDGMQFEESKAASAAGKDLKYVFNEFFRTYSEDSAADGDDVAHIGLSSMTENFNKKRSMDIEIESDSVSVMLYDDSAEGEIITAFWVEGIYQNSYEEDGKYYLNSMKTVTVEDVENGYYLPMIGDAEKGTYYLEEEKIVISEKIIKGAISIWVEIDIATGEYEITASVI